MIKNPQKEPSSAQQTLTILKSLLFVLLVPVSVAGLIPLWIGSQSVRRENALNALAIPAWIAGAAILAWTVWDFTFKGRGTPAPVDPPKQLVVEGLYRYTRNPMYLGVLLALLGHVLWQQTLRIGLYSAVVFAAFNAFVIFYEEPNLQRRFGEAYTRYRQSVPRWIPMPRRSSGGEESL